jgi:hypothetical protein
MRALVTVLVAACSAPIGFDVPFDVPELTIDAAPSGETLPFTFDVELTPGHSDVTDVSNVTLASIAFTVTKDSGCFGFVDDVTLWIASTREGSTLPRAVVATVSSPGCVQEVSLAPVGLNLAPYLKEGATISALGNGTRPPGDVSFDGHVVLHASL